MYNTRAGPYIKKHWRTDELSTEHWTIHKEALKNWWTEHWALKNWCFWTVVLEKTLESPLDCKIKPIDPKGNQPWVFIGKTDAKAEAPILWLPDAKSWLTGKEPDTGKDWSQKERQQQRMRWLDSITDSMDMNLSNSRRIANDREAGVLRPWGHKESGTTYWLKKNNRSLKSVYFPSLSPPSLPPSISLSAFFFSLSSFFRWMSELISIIIFIDMAVHLWIKFKSSKYLAIKNTCTSFMENYETIVEVPHEHVNYGCFLK